MATVFVFCFSVYSQRSRIFQKFDYKTWEDKYNKSQWVVPQSKNEISDEDLYLFVGSRLIRGHDPTLLNAEVPPLGKYLIGHITNITGYIGIYGLIFSGLSLLLFFIFNRIIFKSNLIAIIPVFLFSLGSLFQEQVGPALLDAQYLCLLLLTFIFLLKKKYLLTGVFAGLFVATKSPFLVAVLYATLFSFIVLRREVGFKSLVLMPIITAVTYFASYSHYFLLGHNLVDLLKVQKYLIHFYQIGAKGTFGAVFPLTLVGYWITWFNKNQFVRDWNILWPLSFAGTIYAIYLGLKERNFKSDMSLLVIWVILYTAFLTLVPVFPRYLLLSLPFMYNLAIWALLKTIRPHLLPD